MSDFVFVFRSTAEAFREHMGTPERAQKSLESWMKWQNELEAKGHLKAPGPPLERVGKVVDGKSGKQVVIDGPYAETKDLVSGFLIVEAADIAEAVSLASRCPMVEGGGSVEVRPVMTLFPT